MKASNKVHQDQEAPPHSLARLEVEVRQDKDLRIQWRVTIFPVAMMKSNTIQETPIVRHTRGNTQSIPQGPTTVTGVTSLDIRLTLPSLTHLILPSLLTVDIRLHLMADTKSLPMVDTKPRLMADTKSLLMVDIKPRLIADTKSLLMADTKPRLMADTKPRLMADTKPRLMADTKPSLMADTKSLLMVMADTLPPPMADTQPLVMEDLPEDTGQIPTPSFHKWPLEQPVHLPLSTQATL